jgi:hypothetical protein
MRAERNARQFKDPDSLAAQQPSQAELNRIGFWTTFDREAMDAAFRLAMTIALEERPRTLRYRTEHTFRNAGPGRRLRAPLNQRLILSPHNSQANQAA